MISTPKMGHFFYIALNNKYQKEISPTYFDVRNGFSIEFPIKNDDKVIKSSYIDIYQKWQ